MTGCPQDVESTYGFSSTARLEIDRNIHSNFYRHAVLHGWTESPLFESVDRNFVQFPIQGSDHSHDFRRPVFEDHRIEHDRAGGRLHMTGRTDKLWFDS